MPISYDRYDFSTDGGATWLYTDQSAGAGETTNDSLCGAGQSCTYRIRAYTDAGFGAYAAAVTAVNNTASAPQSLTASRIEGNPVRLSWKAPSSTGGLPVSYFRYDFSTDGGATWLYTDQYAGAGTSSEDSLCSSGQTCTYRVRAYTDAGFGAYSNLASLKLP